MDPIKISGAVGVVSGSIAGYAVGNVLGAVSMAGVGGRLGLGVGRRLFGAKTANSTIEEKIEKYVWRVGLVSWTCWGVTKVLEQYPVSNMLYLPKEVFNAAVAGVLGVTGICIAVGKCRKTAGSIANKAPLLIPGAAALAAKQYSHLKGLSHTSTEESGRSYESSVSALEETLKQAEQHLQTSASGSSDVSS